MSSSSVLHSGGKDGLRLCEIVSHQRRQPQEEFHMEVLCYSHVWPPLCIPLLLHSYTYLLIYSTSVHTLYHSSGYAYSIVCLVLVNACVTFLSVSLSLSHSFSLTICLILSLTVFLVPCLSLLSQPVWHSPLLSLHVSCSFCLLLSVFLSACLNISHPHTHPHQSLSVCLSPSLSTSLSLCLSHSLPHYFLSVSLSTS